MGAVEEQLPPAGWYADPEGELGQRYWDGERWTDDRRIEQAQPLDSLARWTVWSLLLAAVVSAASLALDLPHLIRVEDALDGQLTSAELAESRNRTDAGLLVAGLALLPAVFTFLLWYYRAYRNLPRLGATDLKHRNWAIVLYWFIPLVSLLLPKRVLNDVWRASDPEPPPAQGRRWRGRPIPTLLGWWWGVVVAYQLATGRVFALDTTGDGLEDERSEMLFSIFADLLGIAASVITILVVKRVTERQEERRRLFEASVAGP